jgi:hypothetical protein
MLGADPGSQARYSGGHGLLALTLSANGYKWHYLHADSDPFADSGAGRCR